MEILRAENLIKTYAKSGGRRVTALDGVSVTVERGEFISIVGPSGSGKSTLIHILGSIDRPDSGKVFLNGDRDIFALHKRELAVLRRRHFGIIFQFNNLLPILSVRDNIFLPADLDSSPVDEAYANELIETLGLKNCLEDSPATLSGGQQKRVSIGKALINMPDVVLADEPTSNLDYASKQDILNLLKYFNRQYDQTILLITHDMNIALQADRMLTVENGRIRYDDRIR